LVLNTLTSVAAVVARLDEGAALPGWIVFDHLSEPGGEPGCGDAIAAAVRGLVELQGDPGRSAVERHGGGRG